MLHVDNAETWTEGAAGGSTQRRMERGGDCVERNRSERTKVANVAEWKPPARPESGYQAVACFRSCGSERQNRGENIRQVSSSSCTVRGLRANRSGSTASERDRSSRN